MIYGGQPCHNGCAIRATLQLGRFSGNVPRSSENPGLNRRHYDVTEVELYGLTPMAIACRRFAAESCEQLTWRTA